MTKLSIVMMTWERPDTMLNNSLWTLTHQSVQPIEIVVVEASPTESRHADTRALCARYSLVKLIETAWPGFNISRGYNVGIKNTRPDTDYVAAVCMELLFSENFIEAALRHVRADFFTRAACGSLWEDTPIDAGPEYVRQNWEAFCSRARPYPPPLAPGAFMCARRQWWFDIHGGDEIRRPYSYQDIDLQDRAIRSGLQVAALGGTEGPCPSFRDPHPGVYWQEAQTLHPYHPISGLFYSVSGHPIDAAGIDKSIIRNGNGEDWGIP